MHARQRLLTCSADRFDQIAPAMFSVAEKQWKLSTASFLTMWLTGEPI